MQGLIVDFVGVLDGTDEEQRRWKALLSAVRQHGIPVAILSNDPGGPGAQPIRDFQEQGYVDAVVLSGEIGYAKPDAEAFAAAATAIGIVPNDCVMVDDSILNVRAAVEAGLVGVYFQQFDRSVVEITRLFGIDGDF
ncbi:MAG: HAD-IA family hydrolase [Corynebacterium sp.]|nr:HAD-IA family hydrolase [Corynebacterium sp.]